MRFWRPFHSSAIDIISKCPNKLIFRAPENVRLQMIADHIDSNQSSGSCFTHYNHETCLWECYHSPSTTGYHRLFIWLLDSDCDDSWATAARFDVSIEQIIERSIYPTTTNVFNALRCQLITPMNGVLSKEALPPEIIIRVPSVHDVQLQIDDTTLVTAKSLEKDTYMIEIPSVIPNHVKHFVLMGLCFDDMHYSILIKYKIV